MTRATRVFWVLLLAPGFLVDAALLSKRFTTAKPLLVRVQQRLTLPPLADQIAANTKPAPTSPPRLSPLENNIAMYVRLAAKHPDGFPIHVETSYNTYADVMRRFSLPLAIAKPGSRSVLLYSFNTGAFTAAVRDPAWTVRPLDQPELVVGLQPILQKAAVILRCPRATALEASAVYNAEFSAALRGRILAEAERRHGPGRRIRSATVGYTVHNDLFDVAVRKLDIRD